MTPAVLSWAPMQRGAETDSNPPRDAEPSADLNPPRDAKRRRCAALDDHVRIAIAHVLGLRGRRPSSESDDREITRFLEGGGTVVHLPPDPAISTAVSGDRYLHPHSWPAGRAAPKGGC